MKKHLQLWHLILLFVVPVLYTVLKLNSESLDYLPSLLGNILIVVGSAWSAYIIVMTVRHGDKDSVLKNLLNEYRTHLNKNFFLLFSNIILTSAAFFLLYQLMYFRQIEFNSTTDIRLILSDVVGQQKTLAIIKGGQATKLRLEIGKRHLAYIQLSNNKINALDPIEVPSWWSNKEIPTINIKTEDKTYEELEIKEPDEEQPYEELEWSTTPQN